MTHLDYGDDDNNYDNSNHRLGWIFPVLAILVIVWAIWTRGDSDADSDTSSYPNEREQEYP